MMHVFLYIISFSHEPLFGGREPRGQSGRFVHKRSFTQTTNHKWSRGFTGIYIYICLYLHLNANMYKYVYIYIHNDTYIYLYIII